MSTEQPQQPQPPQQLSGKSSTGLDENLAALLCYLAGWVTGIVFLVLEKENKTVRFHAWQSIFTFAGLTVLSIGMGFIPIIRVFGFVISIAGVILWVLLMYKAFQGGMYKLPVAGDMADKQVNR